jgi:hypothetical protein
MVREFDKLFEEERKLLYEAPVLVSLLASCSFGEVNKDQKADAIKLSHIKTFSSAPLLLPYYLEVEKKFKEEFEKGVKKYFPFDQTRRNEIRKEIDKVNRIIGKLDRDFGLALHSSLDGYAKHVSRAAHSVFQDFIFPMPIPGLTD